MIVFFYSQNHQGEYFFKSFEIYSCNICIFFSIWNLKEIMNNRLRYYVKRNCKNGLKMKTKTHCRVMKCGIKHWLLVPFSYIFFSTLYFLISMLAIFSLPQCSFDAADVVLATYPPNDDVKKIYYYKNQLDKEKRN